MIIRLADENDLEALIEVRLAFYRECFPPVSAEKTARLTERLREYYPPHINRDFAAVLAEDNGQIAACAFLTLVERPASPSVPNGRAAEVGNVLTYPAYRRRGLATAVMKEIIAQACRMGAARLDLAASPAGAEVYKKLGFVEHAGHTHMQLPLTSGHGDL